MALLASLPKELIATLAGLALIGAITANLAGAIAAEKHREASVIAFLASASGMSFLGLGAAFWEIVIGMLAYGVLRAAPARHPEQATVVARSDDILITKGDKNATN